MNEVSKELRCILTRHGVEIWVEKDRIDGIAKALEEAKILTVDGEILATSEIAGIFTPQRMEDYKRVKAGQWKCSKNGWHDKGQKCECSKQRVIMRNGEKVRQIFILGNGWVDE